MKHTWILLVLIIACTGKQKPEEERDIVYKHAVGKISTNMGEIIVWLHDETPNHKESFIELANEDYWDSLTFNRVIDDFVAQGGCPDTPKGFSDSPYLLKPEFHPELRHIYGALGAGRDGNPEMLSAGCQFYIVQSKEGLVRLDDKYTVFGQVISGMDLVDQIVKVETDSLDEPLSQIRLDVDIIKLTTEELLEKYGYDASN